MTDDPDHGEPDAVRLDQLARAVHRLPRRQRDLFYAWRVDNLRYAEIAERSGMSVAQVKALLADALFRIARSIERAERRCWWHIW